MHQAFFIIFKIFVTRFSFWIIQGFHVVLKVLNCEIGFQNLGKVLN